MLGNENGICVFDASETPALASTQIYREEEAASLELDRALTRDVAQPDLRGYRLMSDV